jgi:hypothetical protein
MGNIKKSAVGVAVAYQLLAGAYKVGSNVSSAKTVVFYLLTTHRLNDCPIISSGLKDGCYKRILLRY